MIALRNIFLSCLRNSKPIWKSFKDKPRNVLLFTIVCDLPYLHFICSFFNPDLPLRYEIMIPWICEKFYRIIHSG